MKYNQTLTTLSLLTITSGLAIAQPDLIVSEITSAATFGVVDGKIAYSFGATLCNIGDDSIDWTPETNAHPVISQTLYRLADGQIQQIGIGFVRHGIFPLASDACGLGCTAIGLAALGPGCSTENASMINGLQPLMGPRTEIDPFSGFFPFPFTSADQAGDAIYKRLQVNIDDVSDQFTLYFIETQVITGSETTAETKANNVSYRQVVFSHLTADAVLVGPTYAGQPAIFAWRDHGNGIGMPNADVLISEATIPGDGIIHVGSLVTDLGDGTFRYDYAIHNQNAQNAISSLMVPGAGLYDQLTDVTFHDVEYHDDVDGQVDGTDTINYSSTINTFWTNTSAPGIAIQEDANVVRWGTTYSYSFTTPNEPRSYHSVLHYGIPGSSIHTSPMVVDTTTPTQGDVCFIDLNGDGVLNFYEVALFVGEFSAQSHSVDFVPDGLFDFFDVSAFLSAFAAGCP